MTHVRIRPAWVVIAGLLSFLLALTFVDRNLLYQATESAIASIMVGVLVAYWPGYYPAILEAFRPRSRPSPTGHFLFLGIGLLAFGRLWRVTVLWVWRYLDQPDWMIDHWLGLAPLWLEGTGGVLILSARDAVHGHIPPAHWIRLGIVAALSVALTLAVLTFVRPLHL